MSEITVQYTIHRKDKERMIVFAKSPEKAAIRGLYHLIEMGENPSIFLIENEYKEKFKFNGIFVEQIKE